MVCPICGAGVSLAVEHSEKTAYHGSYPFGFVRQRYGLLALGMIQNTHQPLAARIGSCAFPKNVCSRSHVLASSCAKTDDDGFVFERTL